MKIIAGFYLGITMLIMSCTDNKTKEVITATGTENMEIPEPVVADALCFSQENAKDTIQMQLNISGNVVNGTLDYMLKEKDKNEGTIVGTIKMDTLIAAYSFDSEGTRSVRQVAFLLKDGKAIEGYGDLEEKNGQLQFKNVSAISFGKGVVLDKVECK